MSFALYYNANEYIFKCIPIVISAIGCAKTPVQGEHYDKQVSDTFECAMRLEVEGKQIIISNIYEISENGINCVNFQMLYELSSSFFF